MIHRIECSMQVRRAVGCEKPVRRGYAEFLLTRRDMIELRVYVCEPGPRDRIIGTRADTETGRARRMTATIPRATGRASAST